jgi:hypothetical protein
MESTLSEVWIAASVVLGFQLTSFSWRISRELQFRDPAIRWLPPADILNLGSFAITVIGVFLVPVLVTRTDASFARSAFAVALVLLLAYPFAVVAHYSLLQGRDAPRSRRGEEAEPERQARRRDAGTRAERAIVVTAAVLAVIYAAYLILARLW